MLIRETNQNRHPEALPIFEWTRKIIFLFVLTRSFWKTLIFSNGIQVVFWALDLFFFWRRRRRRRCRAPRKPTKIDCVFSLLLLLSIWRAARMCLYYFFPFFRLSDLFHADRARPRVWRLLTLYSSRSPSVSLFFFSRIFPFHIDMERAWSTSPKVRLNLRACDSLDSSGLFIYHSKQQATRRSTPTLLSNSVNYWETSLHFPIHSKKIAGQSYKRIADLYLSSLYNRSGQATMEMIRPTRPRALCHFQFNLLRRVTQAATLVFLLPKISAVCF